MTDPTPDVKSLFGQALERSAGERAAFLDAACAGHPAVREELDALLGALEQAGDFLKPLAPPVGDGQTVDLPAAGSLPTGSLAEERPGVLIAGRYKLLQQIGEGGMGTVWMADQIAPVKRRVAVKLIRDGRGDSKSILSRFEAERQAIALMDHPHIAKLLDAGTSEAGQPFFVMELVKGVPLTDYCDAHRLSIPDRLALFQQICGAVQHAHQKGVIHRDLKPTNILVESHDGKPVPKVIDFGLAKATSGLQLTDHTLFTAFGSVLGTPLYMAPEQATFNAVDVDTRADVYALGVVLYELLTGSTPLTRETVKKAALDEMLKLIREQEAPTPSSRLSTTEGEPTIAANRQAEPGKLSRMLKGELDWIVLRALAKERERRYESAAALARDVGRHLTGDAVEACPPTLGYRLKKAYRRNRTAVLGGGLIALIFLTAATVSVTFGVLANEAKRQARADRDAALKAEGEAATNAEAARTEADRAKAEQDRTRRLLYAAQLAQADQAFSAGKYPLVKQLLADAGEQSDLRGWEWHYLDRQVNPRPQRVLRFDGRFTDLSADLRRLVARRNVGDGVVFDVWDTDTERRVGTVPGTGPLPATDYGGERVVTGIRNDLIMTDDRHLAILFEVPKEEKQPVRHRIRIWDVETGREIPGPPDIVPVTNGLACVGPDAAWAAWIEAKAIEPKQEPGKKEPVAVTVGRWERSTGKVTRTVVPLTRLGNCRITLDGESVIAYSDALVGSQFGVPLSPAEKPIPPADRPAWVECWDLRADPPRLRWPSLELGNGRSISINHQTSALAVVGEREMATYSLKNGHRTGVGPRSGSASAWQRELWTFAEVATDGKRVLLPQDGGYLISDLTTDGRTTGSRVDLAHYLRFDSVSRRCYLSPDGMSVWTVDSSSNALEMFDVSRHPDLEDVVPAGREATTSSGSAGGLRLEFASSGPATPAPLRARSVVVRDGSGKEVGRFNPDAGRLVAADLCASDRVLILRWPIPSELSFGSPATPDPVVERPEPEGRYVWELYAPDGATGLRKVAVGDGQRMMMAPGKSTLGDVRQRLVPPGREQGLFCVRTRGPAGDVITFRDVRTGNPVGQSHKPPGGRGAGHVLFPDGKRYAELTYAGDPSDDGNTPLGPGVWRSAKLPARKVSLRAVEILTGAEVWRTDLGVVCGSEVTRLAISPDGSRIGFTTLAEEASTLQVWVIGAADGVIAKAASFPLATTFSPARDMALKAFRGWAPDGRLVLTLDRTVELFDPTLGRPTLLLRNDGGVLGVHIPPGSDRIFVINSGTPEGELGRVRNLLRVWDLSTGRPLLTLPMSGSGARGMEWRDGKFISQLTPTKQYVIDGTPLPEAKK